MEFLHDLVNQHNIVLVLIIVGISVALFLLNNRIKAQIEKSGKKLKLERTHLNFLKNASSFFLLLTIIILALSVFPSSKKYGNTLFASAGVIAAVLSFSAQHAFANIISGIFIVIFRPFRVGDVIEIGGYDVMGEVQDITLRHTIIKDYYNKRVIIPNQTISTDRIVNSDIDDHAICRYLEFPFPQDVDYDHASDIIREIGAKHPLSMDYRTEEHLKEGRPYIKIRIVRIEKHAIVLRAYLWAETSDKSFVLKCDVLEECLRRFQKEGIRIALLDDQREEKRLNY
ncbi:mechanosensitive ion channel family protein [Sediminitomix flava]|uniref:Small-conductance mechanosensitive channel n=1 Tax=Sediminitomix flava TaxID=379075 RepID=A0A315ZH26_SEDFL|nr:mechanosensitive ion channel family protein [Sediminitomix flava]PWJ44473.1 small-conductance mechanosensitive channel [Sediminitomix flava]